MEQKWRSLITHPGSLHSRQWAEGLLSSHIFYQVLEVLEEQGLKLEQRDLEFKGGSVVHPVGWVWVFGFKFGCQRQTPCILQLCMKSTPFSWFGGGIRGWGENSGKTHSDFCPMGRLPPKRDQYSGC
jgi:hypothetical protein